MIKTCIQCKTNFISHNGMQKYCSQDCFNISRNNYKKRYNQIHKEEIRKYIKLYNKQYRKTHIINRSEYFKVRKQNDINFKLVTYLRTRVTNALKRNTKSASINELLGCSIDYLKIHLEKKFKEGMKWSNYGKDGWEIDHIKPCYSFDLSKKSEQLKCFNYKNLQPLWAIDNRIKNKF